MTIRTPHKTLGLVAVLLIALALAACAGPGTLDDPYADPGTAPPPTITDPTITTSGSIAPRPGTDNLMDINVAGFAAPGTEGTLPALGAGDFTVVEDGVVKGITVERIGGTVRAAADIAFVFDTTGSMGGALRSVQDSIVEFVDFLDERGLDVRVGAVTFGDAYDTQVVDGTRGTSISDWTPPGFDPSERPSFPLSGDFDAFRTFIEGDSPRGGGDVPENALGALEFAYDTLDWRDGAQKILVVIIDTCSHNDVTFTRFGEAGEPWMPPNPDDLIARMRGDAIVHSVSPPNVIETDFSCSDDHTDMAMFTGVAGTGGVFVPVEFGAFDFDLTELPIAEAAAGGYIVTYRGTRTGATHTVRVVIDDGGEIRGEFTTTATY